MITISMIEPEYQRPNHKTIVRHLQKYAILLDVKKFNFLSHFFRDIRHEILDLTDSLNLFEILKNKQIVSIEIYDCSELTSSVSLKTENKTSIFLNLPEIEIKFELNKNLTHKILNLLLMYSYSRDERLISRVLSNVFQNLTTNQMPFINLREVIIYQSNIYSETIGDLSIPDTTVVYIIGEQNGPINFSKTYNKIEIIGNALCNRQNVEKLPRSKATIKKEDKLYIEKVNSMIMMAKNKNNNAYEIEGIKNQIEESRKSNNI